MTTTESNRLEGETSPYLLEHADNPVDWYPWCDEALDRARDEDKPIFLSIGYSACHWCHVMKRESFEDTETADLLNEHFVSIKVDREERPDLDEIYMQAVQSMTGRGGWPMSVFLTPELKPFYGGTYFPPEPRQGMPAFKEVLRRVSETYREERGEVENSADQLVDNLDRMGSVASSGEVPSREVVESAYQSLSNRFDDKWGGFGDAPKFPRPMDLQLLIRLTESDGYDDADDMLTTTLNRMMYGGIYDQAGGGFARYSTDRQWLVPHFEKMLYDNAQLMELYATAYAHFDDSRYGRVVHQTVEYVEREMTSPEGGFYSTQNAESEGEEGKYYVWDRDEFVEVVPDQPEAVADFFGVTEEGNFEGKNILHVDTAMEAFCEKRNLDPETFQESLWKAVRSLRERRQQRVKPERDEKILADWNGLMAAAHARAGFYLEEPEYVDRAVKALVFLEANHVRDGLLHHVHKDGDTHTPGFLDDYAFLVKAMLETVQVTGDLRWLEEARTWFDRAVERFWDGEDGGFYFSDDPDDDLLVRSKNPQDKAQPSGNSEMVLNALKLSALTGERDFRRYARETLGGFSSLLEKSPGGLARMVCGLFDWHTSPIEVVGVDPEGPDSDLLQPLRERFVPHRLMLPVTPGEESESTSLLDRRTDIDEPTVYVCTDGECQAPANNSTQVGERLMSLLGERSSISM